jgi:diguanylate cyclase (GGDEF)-like protein
MIDKSGLEGSVFSAFSETDDRRYLYLCNMRTNVSRWSPRAVDFFNLPGEYMTDADEIWAELIHPVDRAAYKQDIEAVLAGKKKYHDLEYRVRNRDGEYVICTCKGLIISGSGDEPDFFAGSIINHGIMDRVDATTHLYNIYEFRNAMYRELELQRTSLVMLVGINQFRNVNDLYGYVFGNQVLRIFAEKLLAFMAGKGMVYRMDGARFALHFTEGIDKNTAKELYAQIQNISKREIIVENEHIPLSVSGGAVEIDEHIHENIGEYSIRASVSYAQDQSKRVCHSELVFFENEQEKQGLQAIELFETIRQCVLRGCEGFYLCYQPVVKAKSGEICGAEALLRWDDEKYGEFFSEKCIEWLEKDECYFELGKWIFRQALRDGAKLRERKPDFVMNVNVTYIQLEREEFKDELLEILEETGFPPENLYLELTERCQVQDLEQLREKLECFASYGVRIALDDFGIGTAAMNLLRKLPINCVKIDRDFIADIMTNEKDEIIVDMVTTCADRLGIAVCMEGIENRKLRDYVQKYKVRTHQGYYYSSPVRYEEIQTMI